MGKKINFYPDNTTQTKLSTIIMLTETISRPQFNNNTTQEDQLFDQEILQTVNLNKNQVLISKLQREKKNLFKNLMYNNFPVPTLKRSLTSSSSSSHKYSCNDSTSCSTHNCEEDFEDESNFASID